MLAQRFAQLHRCLRVALAALVVRGREPMPVIAAVTALAVARGQRLQALMTRFVEGRLRPRTGGTTRRARPDAAAAAAAAAGREIAFAAKGWPEHRRAWLGLMAANHPSADVRHRWEMQPPPPRAELVRFGSGLRHMVATDAEMRGLLAASREARRITRWFLKMASREPPPAILLEPARPKPPQPKPPRPKRAPRPRAKRDRWAPPPPPRVPNPWEVPPANLSREERERRGLWVPEPIRLYDMAGEPFTPDWIQRGWRGPNYPWKK